MDALKEYKILQKSIHEKELMFNKESTNSFQTEINDYAKEGWELKFSNIAVVPDDPAKVMSSRGTEAIVVFYAILERDINQLKKRKGK